MRTLEQIRKDHRSRKYRHDADDDGRWITTENGHHVHINAEGNPDKGNPHVIEAMTGGKSGSSGKQKKSIAQIGKSKGWKKVSAFGGLPERYSADPKTIKPDDMHKMPDGTRMKVGTIGGRYSFVIEKAGKSWNMIDYHGTDNAQAFKDTIGKGKSSITPEAYCDYVQKNAKDPGSKSGFNKIGIWGNDSAGKQDTKSTKLTQKQAQKIRTAATKKAWTDSGVKACLDHVSEKLTGWEYTGDGGFDVGYEGSAKELTKEIASIYKAAGVEVSVKGNRIKVPGGAVIISKADEAYGGSTFTDKDKPYWISTENYM